MEKLSTDATAALAALSLKKSVEDDGSDYLLDDLSKDITAEEDSKERVNEIRDILQNVRRIDYEHQDWFGITTSSPTLKVADLKLLSKFFGTTVERQDGNTSRLPLKEDYMRKLQELNIDEEMFLSRQDDLAEAWGGLVGADDTTIKHLLGRASHGTGGHSVAGGNGDDSDDLSSISDEPPTPTMTATIFRRKQSDPSLVTKLGINEVIYDPADKIFFAHPAGSPTTPALVAKVPIPDDGKG